MQAIALVLCLFIVGCAQAPPVDDSVPDNPAPERVEKQKEEVPTPEVRTGWWSDCTAEKKFTSTIITCPDRSLKVAYYRFPEPAQEKARASLIEKSIEKLSKKADVQGVFPAELDVKKKFNAVLAESSVKGKSSNHIFAAVSLGGTQMMHAVCFSQKEDGIEACSSILSNIAEESLPPELVVKDNTPAIVLNNTSITKLPDGCAAQIDFIVYCGDNQIAWSHASAEHPQGTYPPVEEVARVFEESKDEVTSSFKCEVGGLETTCLVKEYKSSAGPLRTVVSSRANDTTVNCDWEGDSSSIAEPCSLFVKRL